MFKNLQPAASFHFITTDFPPNLGGLETYAWEITQGLSEIDLVSAALGKGIGPPQTTQKRNEAQRRYRWHRRRDRLGAGLWSALDAFLSPAGTRLHMQWSTAIPSYLRRRQGLPGRYIVLAHGAEIADRNPWMRLTMKRVFEAADAVVTGSQFTRNFLLQSGIRPRRLEVIAYGASPPPPPADRAKPGQGTKLELICAHRLVPRKGTALLLQSLAALSTKSWHLSVIGDGSEKQNLMQMSNRLGLDANVSFLGSVSEADKKKRLSQSDLFLLPSLPPLDNNHVEGLGLGLLEAQGYGLPVLAANTGGIPEALVNGETGWLFQPGSLSALTQALTACLSQPQELAKRGGRGPTFIAEHYDWNKTMREWRGLLASLPG